MNIDGIAGVNVAMSWPSNRNGLSRCGESFRTMITLVVVFALGVGIPASLTPHHLLDAILDESPPFHQGDQVVGVAGLDQESGRQEPLRLGETIDDISPSLPVKNINYCK